MRVIALDVGKRHTGVAYADALLDVPVPLETIHHENEEELLAAIATLVSERHIGMLILGLPLLPSGVEAEQALYVRQVGKALQESCKACVIRYLDERRTTKRAPQDDKAVDDHAQAALTLLQVFLERGARALEQSGE